MLGWERRRILRYGFLVPSGDPRTVAGLAQEVEAAGWDGVFYWDGICVGAMETYDPWVVMAAMAMRTERVRIGAVLTPPARRRPWKLARETVTLDHLSGGRIVLPVGLGAIDDPGFAGVGEPTDRLVRAELLDESLEILTRAWSGEPFTYEGKHYQMTEMIFRPPSVQQPRIPIWVVAIWPRRESRCGRSRKQAPPGGSSPIGRTRPWPASVGALRWVHRGEGDREREKSVRQGR